jgi:hypothetical protein
MTLTELIHGAPDDSEAHQSRPCQILGPEASGAFALPQSSMTGPGRTIRSGQ